MKNTAVVFLMLVLMSCTAMPTSSSEILPKAIYLVQGMGQLPQKDLQAHPEIAVTNDFEGLKQLARNKAALWIDINAVGIVDRNWLNQEPQRFYPIVLIGLAMPCVPLEIH